MASELFKDKHYNLSQHNLFHILLYSTLNQSILVNSIKLFSSRFSIIMLMRGLVSPKCSSQSLGPCAVTQKKNWLKFDGFASASKSENSWFFKYIYELDEDELMSLIINSSSDLLPQDACYGCETYRTTVRTMEDVCLSIWYGNIAWMAKTLWVRYFPVMEVHNNWMEGMTRTCIN